MWVLIVAAKNTPRPPRLNDSDWRNSQRCLLEWNESFVAVLVCSTHVKWMEFFFFKSRAPWSIVEVAWLHFCARETAKSRRDWLSLTPLRRCLIREVLNVKGIDRCKHSGFILGSSADKSAIRATAETPIDWVEICDMSAMTSMPLLAWKSTFRSRAVWD